MYVKENKVQMIQKEENLSYLSDMNQECFYLWVSKCQFCNNQYYVRKSENKFQFLLEKYPYSSNAF